MLEGEVVERVEMKEVKERRDAASRMSFCITTSIHTFLFSHNWYVCMRI